VDLAGIVTGAGQQGCFGTTATGGAAAASHPTNSQPGDEPTFSADFEEPETKPFTNTPYTSTSVANIGGYCCGLTGPELKTTAENSAGYNSRGPGSLLYSGVDKDATKSFAYMKAFAPTGVVLGPDDVLDYWIYPQGSPKGVGSNSTCVAVDLVFANGKTLRDSGLKDMNGVSIHPAQQCRHLKLNEWNEVSVELGTFGRGNTVKAVNLGYDQPSGTGAFRGYIDNITIRPSFCSSHPDSCTVIHP
jgi:hypothetical protein